MARELTLPVSVKLLGLPWLLPQIPMFPHSTLDIDQSDVGSRGCLVIEEVSAEGYPKGRSIRQKVILVFQYTFPLSS